MLSHFNCVRLFATLWPIAFQAPLSIGFFRQEYWSGLPSPSPGDLPDSGIKPRSLKSPVLAGGDSLTLVPPSPTQNFDIGKICCGRCMSVCVCVCTQPSFFFSLLQITNILMTFISSQTLKYIRITRSNSEKYVFLVLHSLEIQIP